MADYRYIARRLLKDNRPKELKELRSAGRLEAFLDAIQEYDSQRELEAVRRTMKALPPEMSYPERVRQTDTAKQQIQEFLIGELRDLLGAEPEDPDPEARAYRKRRQTMALGEPLADWDQMSREQQDRTIDLGLGG